MTDDEWSDMAEAQNRADMEIEKVRELNAELLKDLWLIVNLPPFFDLDNAKRCAHAAITKAEKLK